jgi:hypothetical protein
MAHHDGLPYERSWTQESRRHEWWVGHVLDHLYENCPAFREQVKTRGSGLIEPLGRGVCGWCQRAWKARRS